MLAAPTCQLGCQRVMRELTDTQEQLGTTEGLRLGASWAGEPKDAREEGDTWDCKHRAWWPAISPSTASARCTLFSAGSMPEGSFCAVKVVGLKRSCGLGTVSLLVLQRTSARVSRPGGTLAVPFRDGLEQEPSAHGNLLTGMTPARASLPVHLYDCWLTSIEQALY